MNDAEVLVRRMIDAFNADDHDALRAILHPDITVRRPLPDVGLAGQASDVGVYQGMEEVLPMLSELIARVGGIAVDVREVEEVTGDAALLDFVARLGPPENSSAWLGCAVFRIEDGLVVSTETFASAAEARRAIAEAA